MLCLICIISVVLLKSKAEFGCTTGRWGAQCTKTCGQCEGGPEFCQVYDGLCVNGCASGYTGPLCKEACPVGKYGHYCRFPCGKCSEVRPDCNAQNGKCPAGCEPGYQPPYCDMPCEFDKWGDGCTESCKCVNVTKWGHSCGCDPVTGKCSECGDLGQPLESYPKVKNLEECLNKHMLEGAVAEYVPPSALDFPYQPILAVGIAVLIFVLTQFLWWFVTVRRMTTTEEPTVFIRSKKPPKAGKSQQKLPEAFKVSSNLDNGADSLATPPNSVASSVANRLDNRI